jgi:hypothetical protein
MSLISLLVVGVYALFKYDTFRMQKGSEIIQTVMESYYPPDEVFDASKDFALAVSFIDHYGNMLDPAKGEIAFYRNEWDFDEDGNYIETWEKIPSHVCTD